MKKDDITQEDRNKIKALYEDGLSGCKISKIINCSSPTIYRILKEMGIKARSNKINSKIYSCNENYFENIDTEEKAYWLGFISADGYISIRKNQISFGISIGIKDIQHLYKLNKCLNSTYPIKEYKVTGGYKVGAEYCRLFITSDKLVKDLIYNGVIPHKSLKIHFPTTIPDNLTRHFIRGYFDGNGCYKKNKEGRYDIGFCSTFEFLSALKVILGVEYRPFTKRHKNETNNYDLTIMRMGDRLRITKYMYDGATVFLQRKYERALTILNNIKEVN